jgi:hypothetical protein
MTDQQQPTEDPQSTQPSGDSWQEVGRQFQALGESLATAFRTAWQNEENRQRMQAMRSGLESMAKNLEQTVRDSAASPEAQEAIAKAKQAGVKIRDAGEQTAQEVRPHLLNALQQINAELQKLIQHMDNDKPATPPTQPPSSEPPVEEK